MAAAVKRSARQEPPEGLKALRRAGRGLAVPLGSVLIAFVVGAIIVAVTGGNPFLAYQALFCGGFGVFCFGGEPSVLQLANTLVFITPLIMAGIAVALPFRAGMFNIGAEGQFVMGAILATVLGIHLGGLPAILLIPLVLLGGAVAGAFWGGIAGVLKATTGAHEVVTTIMLNYIAQWFLRFLIIGGPLQLPGGSSRSSPISSNARLPYLLPHDSTQIFGLPGAVYRAHTGLFIALAAAAVFAFLLWRTSLGYEIRAVGQSQRAARYAGISVRGTLIIAMLIAGAFAGLAGAVQVAGVEHNLTDQYFTDSTGFDAIAVALLGLNTAVGIILAAILFGALHAGGSTMQSDAGVSGNLVYILQALILFSIAANFLRTVKLRLPSVGRTPLTPEADAAATAAATEADTGLAADDKDIA